MSTVEAGMCEGVWEGGLRRQMDFEGASGLTLFLQQVLFSTVSTPQVEKHKIHHSPNTSRLLPRSSSPTLSKLTLQLYASLCEQISKLVVIT